MTNDDIVTELRAIRWVAHALLGMAIGLVLAHGCGLMKPVKVRVVPPQPTPPWSRPMPQSFGNPTCAHCGDKHDLDNLEECRDVLLEQLTDAKHERAEAARAADDLADEIQHLNEQISELDIRGHKLA